MLAEKLSSPGPACCEREESCVTTFDLISRNDTKVHLGVFILLLFRHLLGITGKPLHGPVHGPVHQAQRTAAVRGLTAVCCHFGLLGAKTLVSVGASPAVSHPLQRGAWGGRWKKPWPSAENVFNALHSPST